MVCARSLQSCHCCSFRAVQCRHIVLLVHDTSEDRWGAVGISRRSNLMYKPLEYPSMSSVLADFRRSYSAWNHNLVKARALANLPSR